jgi:hypothetical protein
VTHGAELPDRSAGPASTKIRLVTAPDRARAGRRLRRALVLALLLALLLVVPTATAHRPSRRAPPRPATLAPAAVLSEIERAGTVSIARDCGFSAPLPAAPSRSLWLFCDTPVYQRNADDAGRAGWTLERFIPGSTAAVGPAVAGPGPQDRMPGPLSEVPTPAVGAPGARGSDVRSAAAAPAPFLSPPAGLATTFGLPCGSGGSYAASWVSGVARVPSTPYLLVTFNDYCVLSGSGGFLHEGFGLAEYDPARGTLSDVVTAPDGAGLAATSATPLGSPVFSGGYLYLFGPACTAPRAGHCTGTMLEVRVPSTPAAWTDPLSYQWWSTGPSGPWKPDPATATAILGGPKPSGVSVASFAHVGRRYILVEQTSIGGDFTVYQAPSPAGHWRKLTAGRVPCRAGSGYANFCRAIIAHPELSTPTQLVLSYFDPAAEAYGHVMVAGYRW